MEKFAVAPMIDWTDRHCRYFHRALSSEAELYTEMIVDQAILRGDRERLLDVDASKEKVVLQLGGSDPKMLGEAVKIAHDFGYTRINLNCGCPSDRVQAGTFGAVLMREPERVRRILEAMQEASDAQITLKCRIGVDDDEPHKTLPNFLEQVSLSGIEEVTIHARKAWLKGLSPKDNRTIPPLDYDLAFKMRAQFPSLQIALNGGIEDIQQSQAHLERFDGVMLGRAAYQRPYDTLAFVDKEIYQQSTVATRAQVIEEMSAYLKAYVREGGRVHSVTRHMIGLFHGQAGGRRWRQILSTQAKDNDPNLLDYAYGKVLNNL